MSKVKLSTIPIVLLVTLAATISALATEYTYDDLGDITGTKIQLDGDWYSRPGLDTSPPPASYGTYPVQAQLAEGSDITTVNLWHGPPGSAPDWIVQTMTITNGLLEAEIDPLVYGSYCKPVWEYAFYLQGLDSGSPEIDERHYEDGSGGDPYVFSILHPNPNQPPMADPNGPYVFTTDPLTLDGTGSSDPVGAIDSYEWDIIYTEWAKYPESPYYPDGEFDDASGPNPVVTFDLPGEYIIRLMVTDECGEEAFAETMAYSIPPEFVDGWISANPVAVGEEVTITADFLRSTPIVDMSYILFDYTDWLPMTMDGGFPVTRGTAPKTIDTPGVYGVVVRAEDAFGMDAMGFLGLLAVYDPEGGFVTGGGWIWSPEGAYYPDPSLEGRASFGFVSKYMKGADVPTGQTEFQFRVADLNFHSASYDWLVVAGRKAMFKGVGTINGEGEYKFMLSAIDGDLQGGDGMDRFRIRIWEEDAFGNEIVIYDNQLGAYPDADPTTELGGGSIVIHK